MSVLGPIGVSGLNHLFEHIFMMQMFSFNFGFDSGSRAHFRSENLMTDSERKWALEAESKPEIEGKHLHHKDMFK